MRGSKPSKSIPFLLEVAIFRRKFMDPGNKSCEKKKKNILVKLFFLPQNPPQQMLFPNLKTTKNVCFTKKIPASLLHTRRWICGTEIQFVTKYVAGAFTRIVTLPSVPTSEEKLDGWKAGEFVCLGFIGDEILPSYVGMIS